MLAESQLPSVTPAALHIGFDTLQEGGATTLLPASLQIKGSLYDQIEGLHVLPVPEGPSNADASVFLSGLEEGEWLGNLVGNDA